MSAEPAPTVLVVEDDDDHRFLIEQCLTTSGLVVRTATDGEAALSSLDGVDLVLLDHRLPSATGLEILDRIRDLHPEGPAVGGPSVVMVTGTDSGDLVLRAMRAGAIDFVFVVKDTTLVQQLPGVIERAWRHHALARRAHRLQQLALMVNTVGSRDETFAEIVHGARELLRAGSCVLVLRERRPVVAAQPETPWMRSSSPTRSGRTNRSPPPVLGEREVRTDVGDVPVEADPALLQRVLSHLISNVAKYSPPTAPVEIRARCEGPDAVRVEVCDRGVGLTQEEVARVFEPFWRSSHSLRTAARRIGLGLALVRDYVERMGGEITVESAHGAGSVFAFTLPRP